MTKEISVDQFWHAVVMQDYETVRTAIEQGFDVNTKIPGKVDPIIFAQPAEDMMMLRILWEAGAKPATPWLAAIFDDFAQGGDGSQFKTKKPKPVGIFRFDRFNGTEEFALERATLHTERAADVLWITLEAHTNGTIIRSLPDTESLKARPNAEITFPLGEADVRKLSGHIYSPETYNPDTKELRAFLYYVEHGPLEHNVITFGKKKKRQYFVQWTGVTTDINYYDGSKPETVVTIEGWFAREDDN